MKVVMARTLALLLLLPALLAGQSTLTGRWEGKTPGDSPVTIDMAVKGPALTGTMAVDGQTVALEDGKTSKNTLSFTVTMNGRAQPFSGELAGDDLKIWMDQRGPASAITLKRAKAAAK